MNCVFCVVIFFYLLELTLKTQVSKALNTVGISSNALFGNSANNVFEPFSWCKTISPDGATRSVPATMTSSTTLVLRSIRSYLLIRLPFCFCLWKNYVNADAHCISFLLLAMLATAIFDRLFFIKKQYLSKHKHCKSMAFH